MNLFETFENIASQSPINDSRPAAWIKDEVVTWSNLSDAYVASIDQLQAYRSARVGFTPGASSASLAILGALQRLSCETFLIDETWSPERKHDVARQFELEVIVDSEGSSQPTGITRVRQPSDAVTILTSGTTGVPKAVRHSWQSLSRPVRRQEVDRPPVWLLAFRPHLYAGLQVIFQAMLNHGALVFAPPSDPPAKIVELMVKSKLEFASATPSYWRRLLMLAPEPELRRVPLSQITLGGEAVDQPLLDQLDRLYPTARIIHIYATTEMGRCFAVQDKRAGFPTSMLETPTSDGVELKIVDGQLWVRSANAMQGYDVAGGAGDDERAMNDGWFATKDLVKVETDRVLFVGRDSDMINVGGNKVHPGPIEQLIRELPEVADVSIYGVDSSVAGQLVACQAVAAADINPDIARQKILSACNEKLERYQCPRLVEMVDTLELTAAGKLKRKP